MSTTLQHPPSPNPASDRSSSPPPSNDAPAPPPPPFFHPFFPLLTTHSTSNINTSTTTHHPHIHYVFASDPSPNPLDSALLSPLHDAETSRNPQNERYILLDLDASGTKVLNAQSLTPDWAVTKAEVREAPTWGDGREYHRKGGVVRSGDSGEEDVGGEVGGKDMMLVIEGVERADSGGDSGDDAEEEDEEKVDKEGETRGSRMARRREDGEIDREVEDLVEEFGRGMEGLRRVVGVWGRMEERERLVS